MNYLSNFIYETVATRCGAAPRSRTLRRAVAVRVDRAAMRGTCAGGAPSGVSTDFRKLQLHAYGVNCDAVTATSGGRYFIREVCMQKLTRIAIALAGFAISGAATAADAKLLQSCTDCHGTNGLTQSQEIPSIAGISSTVLEGALAGFKAKKLPCAKTSYQQGDTKRPQTDMCTVAAALNDAQVKDLADHFSKQPFKAMKQPFDAAKAAEGKKIHARDCENCHTKNGRDAGDDSSLLAGQPIGYLKATLGDFKAGKRTAEKKMTEKVNKLSAADLEALAHFYGSLQ